jgi:dolichol-phosphate mannosyltransferase
VFLSVVTPAYNEQATLPMLYERLRRVLDPLAIEWEWIVVDDHSRDETFATLRALGARDPRVRAARFSRNFGSHTAIACGLGLAAGDCAAMLAADLQDPPEVIGEMLERWRAGARVVWAARAERPGEKRSTLAFSRLYYWIMRHMVGMKEMPARGADCFLVDRVVLDALRQFGERNVSILGLITWLGFRQDVITYDKEPRAAGRSGWNLDKKLKLVADSVTAFTYLPIRLMSYVGAIVALAGFLYAAFVMGNAILGRPPEGWASLMVVVLVIGGIQMLMMGVLGEYLWRAFDEGRRRPPFIIEDVVNPRA